MLHRWILLASLLLGSSACFAADPFVAPTLTLDSPAATAPAPASPPFSANSWFLSLTGDYLHTSSSHTTAALYGGEFTLGYYVLKDLALLAELPAYDIDQPGPNTEGIGAGLLLRWHFIHIDRFSLFADGGADGLFTRKPVPTGGTYFNFLSKGGLGLTFQFTDNLFLIAGSRLAHLSNAGIRGSDHNPSINLAVEAYTGLMLTF